MSEGPGRAAVPCSKLSDKAASASAAAMPLVGSGLGSTGGGSRGASAFSVCSAPGVEGWGHWRLRLCPGARWLSWTRPLVMSVAQGVGLGASTCKLGPVVPLLCLEQTPQNNGGSLLGNLNSRGTTLHPAPGASQGSPSLHWGPGRWWNRWPRHHNSPLAALSA